MTCKHKDESCENQTSFGDCVICYKADDEVCPFEKLSPLDIEINEGLFVAVSRQGHYIKFVCATGDISIGRDGDLDTFGIILSAEQINEITRVRAALEWDGKE
jgi:hypothetical protein